MRILICLDGSEASKAALYDLHNAGIPTVADVHVVTIVDTWQQPRSLSDAQSVSHEGMEILRAEFPEWNLSTEIREGVPPREILAVARNIEPDLMVLGERHTNGNGANFLGQTTQTLLTEALCSVRISRGVQDKGNRGERILVGFNGSPAAVLAVEAVAARKWGSDAEVKLLAVADSSVISMIGRFTPQMTDATIEARFAQQWAETLAASAIEKLKLAGLNSSLSVSLGHPAEIIIEQAKLWHASSVFVGPHCSLNSFERFLLGSVSVAVAARAACSIEVVRKQPK